MSTTRDLIRRADRRRGAWTEAAAPQPGFQPICPMRVVSERTELQEVSVPVRVAVPQPIRENSVYRQLMRSHDRVHTRHLKG